MSALEKMVQNVWQVKSDPSRNSMFSFLCFYLGTLCDAPENLCLPVY